MANVDDRDKIRGACQALHLADPILVTKVSLTNAEIITLRATAKELVPAPGPNKLLQFIGAILILNAGTEVLTESADNFAIKYDGSTAAAVSGVIETTGFIDQAADTVTNAIPVIDAVDASADIVNKNLALRNTGGDEIAGNVTADATMDVFISYRIIDL